MGWTAAALALAVSHFARGDETSRLKGTGWLVWSRGLLRAALVVTTHHGNLRIYGARLPPREARVVSSPLDPVSP